MTDMETMRGEFAGWSGQRKREFVTNLIPIMRATLSAGAIVAVTQRDLARWAPLIEARGGLHRMYPLLAYCCVRALRRRLSDSGVQHPVGYHFESGDHGTGELHAALNGMAKAEGARGLDNVSFLAKDGVAFLQAADFLAYEGFKDAGHWLDENGRKVRRIDIPRRKSLLALLDGQESKYHLDILKWDDAEPLLNSARGDG